MNPEPNAQQLELHRIVRMLDKAVEMVHDGELTGNLAASSAAAVRSYNATLKHVMSIGAAPSTLFAPLPDDASLTDVGISSAQLAEYLRAGLPEPMQEAERKPTISRALTIGTMVFGGNKGGDKDEIAEMVREHLEEFLRESRPNAAAGTESAQSAASAPPEGAGTETATNGESTPAGRRALPPQQARVEETSVPQAETRR